MIRILENLGIVASAMLFALVLAAAAAAPRADGACRMTAEGILVGGDVAYRFVCIGHCPGAKACEAATWVDDGVICMQCGCSGQVLLEFECVATVSGLGGTGPLAWDCLQIACPGDCTKMPPGPCPAGTPVCGC